MKFTQLELVIAASFPIFRKYASNPTITFSSGRYPLNLQDYLFTTMTQEDRATLKAAGWQTNGAAAWFYESPPVEVVGPAPDENTETPEAIAARLRTGAIYPPLLKSL